MVVTPGNASGVVNVAGLSTPVTISNASKTNGQVGDQLTILGLGGDDHLTGRSGTESSIRLLLNGGDGDDVLSADATLIGGAGDDLFYPLAGTNTIDGGTGFDQIVVDGNDADNSITLGQTLSTVTIGVDGQTSVNDTSNVERIQINAMGGGDTVNLDTLAIPTIVEAGDGDDTVNAATVSAVAVTVNGGAGDDTITGGAMGDNLDGGAGDDQITGGAGEDKLYGGDDSDTFLWAAGDGNDTIEGGAGPNALVMTGQAAASNRFTLAPSDAQSNRVSASWDNADILQAGSTWRRFSTSALSAARHPTCSRSRRSSVPTSTSSISTSDPTRARTSRGFSAPIRMTR